nr:MAG TPA: DNA helix destabilizing protein [Caudoviricetes sp.]
MSTKVITGKVRFSFCHIFEPQKPQGGGEPKYSVTLLIPKGDTATLGKIKAAQAEARENFCKRNGPNALPPKPNHTLHDGDGMRDSGEPYGEECKGCYVITVSSKQKPVIVDAMRNPVVDPGEVHSGCYGRAAINFYGYNSNGKKGISAGLLSIQKLHDGEPFGTVGSADDFDDGYTDGDDDDFM